MQSGMLLSISWPSQVHLASDQQDDGSVFVTQDRLHRTDSHKVVTIKLLWLSNRNQAVFKMVYRKAFWDDVHCTVAKMTLLHMHVQYWAG